MVKHLHFDGYTLAFDWDLDEAMHSTPANSPEKVAPKSVQQQNDVMDTNAAIDAKVDEKSKMMPGNATVITKSELKEDDPAPDESDNADAVEMKVPSEVENTVPDIQIVAPLRNYSKYEEKDELVEMKLRIKLLNVFFYLFLRFNTTIIICTIYLILYSRREERK